MHDGKNNGIFVTYWCKNGVYHRDNGPAIIKHDQTQLSWFKNGLRHREDGPAHINTLIPAYNSWYIDNVNITQEVNDWIKENNYPQWLDNMSWCDNIKLHFKMRFVN